MPSIPPCFVDASDAVKILVAGEDIKGTVSRIDFQNNEVEYFSWTEKTAKVATGNVTFLVDLRKCNPSYLDAPINATVNGFRYVEADERPAITPPAVD